MISLETANINSKSWHKIRKNEGEQGGKRVSRITMTEFYPVMEDEAPSCA